jgi:hypothetical protein
MGAAEKRLDERRNEVRLPSNIKWLGREGSNLRMAESKSGEYLNDIKDASELSLSVRPLTILEDFLRSEYWRPA